MDTTDPQPTPPPALIEAEQLLADLESSDPADTPEIADRVADLLGSALTGDDGEEPI